MNCYVYFTSDVLYHISYVFRIVIKYLFLSITINYLRTSIITILLVLFFGINSIIYFRNPTETI